MVFLRPEIAFTGTELKLGLMSELVLALIFGSLAGVMSSIMIMMGSGQQDAMVKLLALKAWMRARGLKASDKAKILAAFNQQVESSSFDQRAILSDLPPSLATDLAYFMCESRNLPPPVFLRSWAHAIGLIAAVLLSLAPHCCHQMASTWNACRCFVASVLRSSQKHANP